MGRLLGIAGFVGVVVAIAVSTASIGAEDERKLEADAMASLALEDGACLHKAEGLVIQPDLALIDARASALDGPGIVDAFYIGNEAEVARQFSGAVVARGQKSAWLKKDGHRLLIRLARYDLPSGRLAWTPSKWVEVVPCAEQDH